MAERISRILKGQITTSVIYILLGLCLIFMPVKTVNLICKVVFGVVMIAAGLYHIIIYVREKENATPLDMFSGAILLVLGGFLFFNPQIVVKVLPILLGTFILIDSIWTLQGCIRLKKRKCGEWKLLLVGSLVFIGLGVTLVINPFTVVKYTVIFAGWILLCNGVLDLLFLFVLRRGLKRIVEEVNTVEVEAKDVTADSLGKSGAEGNPVEDVQEETVSDFRTDEPYADDASETETEEEPLEEWKD
ncbi:MAG: DUF308 domain-containing protein [Eubacteriales bacterium]|nr:DUF308 domain-containing protein [Eubacteriales bacterium]